MGRAAFTSLTNNKELLLNLFMNSIVVEAVSLRNCIFNLNNSSFVSLWRFLYCCVFCSHVCIQEISILLLSGSPV